MNYTLNQLQIFLKVAQTQSVTKAAEDVKLTQPAVSIQLKNFQEQFDIPLTEIIGRRIYITAFGREMAETVENILDQVNAINQKTSNFRGQLSGRLRISVISTGKYVMPYFMSEFLKHNPGVELMMDVTNRNKVTENLENNEIDFALVSMLPKNIRIEKIDLLQNKLYLVGKTKLEIDDEESLKDVFQDKILIFRESGSGTRVIMEDFIEEHNIKIGRKIELTSNEAVKQALLAGLGYSIMPLIGIKRELLSKDLFIIPIPDLPVISNWQLIWMKGKKHGPIALSFLKHLEAKKKLWPKIFLGMKISNSF